VNFRQAIDEDFEAIACLAEENELLLEGLGVTEFQKMMSWLYVMPPLGKRLQIVCEDQGELVAHYGGVPIQLKMDDSMLLGVLASNLVISKHARKKSPFIPLQSRFTKEYQANEYSFAYGVIRRKGVLEPHMRMGWKRVGDISIYVRPIKFVQFFNKFINNKLLQIVAKIPILLAGELFNLFTRLGDSRVLVQKIDFFDSTFSRFLDAWNSIQKISALRTIEILNWRYCVFKSREYQLFAAKKNGEVTGYMVLRVMKMKQFYAVALVDLLALNGDKETVSALLNKCLDFSKKIKVDVVATAMPPHHPFANLIMRAGFIKSSEKFTLVTHTPKGKINLSRDRFNDWFINWFDHDYV
jgi:hypothetical protein